MSPFFHQIFWGKWIEQSSVSIYRSLPTEVWLLFCIFWKYAGKNEMNWFWYNHQTKHTRLGKSTRPCDKNGNNKVCSIKSCQTTRYTNDGLIWWWFERENWDIYRNHIHLACEETINSSTFDIFCRYQVRSFCIFLRGVERMPKVLIIISLWSECVLVTLELLCFVWEKSSIRGRVGQKV